MIVVMKEKKKSQSSNNEFKGISIFINFLILDKDRAVKGAVEEKISDKIGHGFLRDKIAARAGKIAAAKISDEKLGDAISVKMQESIPEKMMEMGMVVEAKKVFGIGSFFVIKLTLVSIDLQKLLDKAAGSEKANKFNEIMQLLGGNWAKDSLADQMMPMVISKIQEKLPVKMKEKMMEKGLVADIVVKSEGEEASYFFKQMNDMTDIVKEE